MIVPVNSTVAATAAAEYLATEVAPPSSIFGLQNDYSDSVRVAPPIQSAFTPYPTFQTALPSSDAFQILYKTGSVSAYAAGKECQPWAPGYATYIEAVQLQRAVERLCIEIEWVLQGYSLAKMERAEFHPDEIYT